MTVLCTHLMFAACLQMYHLRRPSTYVLRHFMITMNSQSHLPNNVFVELMHSPTSTIEFNFDKIIYDQINGVAMGSLLTPTLASIFVGYHEENFSWK